MAILKKTLFAEDLEKYKVLVEDTDPDSRYFRVSELPDTFTGGKNAFLIQGSEELVADTIVKIEIKDSVGNVIYHEPGEGIPEYYEGVSKVISVYIYPDTTFGPCTITILGELKEYETINGLKVPVPFEWQNKYNVKWQKTVNVNPLLANTTKVRFYRRPKVDITESILPIYNRSVSRKEISGSIDGIAINPVAGADFKNFKGVLQYSLEVTDLNNLSQSMEGETITINGLNKEYTPIISDIISNKRCLVNVPYWITSSLVSNYQSVTPFVSASYTMSYDEQTVFTNSNVSSSFARIKVTDLETFAGDANRIKIYAKSRNSLGDFELLEDIQLESNELLIADEFNNELNVRTGIFSQQILNNFWSVEPLETNANISLDNELLFQSAKLEPTSDISSSTGLFKFYSADTIEFTKFTEYQLDFTPLLSSSIGYAKIEIYGSGSAFVDSDVSTNNGKLIGSIETTKQFTRFDKQQINFTPDDNGYGNLVFLVKGGDWQISNVSLRAAQESAFSPNEITLIANVPTRINNETFDFRVELYDINNNYIPVKIEKTYTFTGGNDVTIGRNLEVNVTNDAFNFSTSSAFPSSILIDYFKTALTGSVTFYSSAVDTTGMQIMVGDLNPSTNYPGLLLDVDSNTKQLTIDNFTGSLSSKTVGAIYYTASCENINRYFTIFRIDQGAPSYLFYATADKNNFTFNPDYYYRSVVTDDYIDIRLVQQNLPAVIPPNSLKIYSSSLNGPIVGGSRYTAPIYNIGGIGNASIYRLYVTSSTHQDYPGDGYYYDLGQSTYDFELVTEDGTFTSSITIDAIEQSATPPLVKFSNENASLSTLSTGFVPSASFVATTGSIAVSVVDRVINYRSPIQNNSFSASIYSTSGVGGANINSNAEYSITQLNNDSGSVTLEVIYKNLKGSSSVFLKDINYSKNKSAAPVLSIVSTPKEQSVTAKSSGEQIDSFSNVSIVVKETYNGSTTNKTITTLTATSSDITSISTNAGTGVITLNGRTLANGTNTTNVNVSATITDSENSVRTITDTLSLSKVNRPVPTVVIVATPQAQAVSADQYGTQAGTLSNVTIDALEGNTSRFTSMVIASTTGFSTPPTVSGQTLTMTSAIMNAAEASVELTVTHTDSEGTTGQTKTIIVRATKVNTGANGANGSNGSNAVTIQINPPSQTITRSNTGTYASTIPFTVLVTETGSLLTYVSGNPSLNNGEFKITNVYSASGITNGNNGTSNILTPIPATSVSPYNTTFAVTYKNSIGIESVTIPFSHSVTPVLDGQTGPGVVFTGVWESGRAYQFSEGAGTGRRDVVLWSASGNAPYDTYYAAIRQHISAGGNVANGAPNQTNQTGWESLGTQDFFVAAKIGLFEESFVQNTLNIGTNNNGGVSTANITLAGGSQYPYISLGQTTQGVYNADGIYIGNDSGNYRMSLRGASGALTWDGSNLNVSGAVKATSGDFEGYMTVAGGNMKIGKDVYSTNDGIYINSNNYWYDDGDFKVGGTEGYMSFDGTTLFVSGAISSSEGSLGGWKLTDSAIYRGTIGSDDTFTTNGGDITLGNGWISAKEFRINSAGNAFFSGSITGGSINIGNGRFVVTNSGNATLSGSINATGGKLGGWVIDGTILRDENSNIKLSPTVPAIEIYNDSDEKKLNIKKGTLTDPAASSTLTINPPNNSHYWPGSIIYNSSNFPQIDEPVYSTGYETLNISTPGIYYASPANWGSNITLGYESNASFTGYAYAYVTAEIHNSTTPSNSSLVQVLSLGYGDDVFSALQSGTVTFLNSYNFSVTLATGTYYLFTAIYFIGSIQTGNLTVDGYADPASVNFSLQLDQIEITDEGILVVAGANNYVKIQRGTSNDSVVVKQNSATYAALTIDNANTSNVNNAGLAINVTNGGVNIADRIFVQGMQTDPLLANQNVKVITQAGTRYGEYFISTSTRRNKLDITPWGKENVLEKIKLVEPKNYVYKHWPSGSPKTLGIIAEDLRDNGLEEAAVYDYEEDGTKTNEVGGIDWEKLTVILWRGMQELTNKVEKLEAIISGSL